MNNINLLIVEDSESQIEEWQRVIRNFNVESKMKNKGLSFSYEIAKTYKAAKEKMSSYNFSAAVIDIRLTDDSQESNETNTDGNAVLEDIISSTMCLAWVYTGQKVDANVPKYLEDYIKIIDRGLTEKSSLLEEISEQKDLLIAMHKIKSKIREAKASHFYSSVWPRWKLWSSEGGQVEDAITRHMATHLHASFLNEAGKVHPEEYYFTGSMIFNQFDTGDITFVDGKHYILVTPRCEIANNKNDYYQFVELEDKQTEYLTNANTLKEKDGEILSLMCKLEEQERDIKESEKQLNDIATDIKMIKSTLQSSLSERSKTQNSNLCSDVDEIIAGELQKLFQLENKSQVSNKLILRLANEKKQTEALLKKAEKAKNKATNISKQLLPHSGGKISLHVLPEIKLNDSTSYGPLHAKFEKLTYISKYDTEKVEIYKSGKYARLSNEFVPSFIERLGSHFSRIGTPDYSHPD